MKKLKNALVELDSIVESNHVTRSEIRLQQDDFKRLKNQSKCELCLYNFQGNSAQKNKSLK